MRPDSTAFLTLARPAFCLHRVICRTSSAVLPKKVARRFTGPLTLNPSPSGEGGPQGRVRGVRTAMACVTYFGNTALVFPH